MTHALREDDVEDALVDEPEEDLDEDEDLEGVEDELDEEEPDDDEERVEAAFEPGSHPRAPAGSDNGGEFTSGGGGSGSSKPAPKPSKKTSTPGKKGAAPAKKRPDSPPRRPIPAGQLGFDGVSGTGYGKPSQQVMDLQEQLNRLHFSDSKGRQLRKDGEFGPLTTDAVKAAQKQLGMNPTGIVDPAFIDRLKSLKAPAKKTKASRVEAAALLDIELARPGTWDLASGKTTFTVEMLQDAARYAAKHADARNALKLGHVDPRFDGEPAFGWLNNADIWLDEDDRGPVLKARQLDGMPDWLAATAKDAWPNRSVEGWTNYQDQDGEVFSFVLDGLALLGVTPPGIGSIRSLRDLPAALGIAASAAAQRVVARAPTAAPIAATAPAPEAEETTTVKEAGQMDPAKIREAIGLSPEASDDEVRSALGAAGLAPTAPVAAAAGPDLPGTMRVDASAWQEREDRLKRLEAAAQRQRENERDQIITEAVKAGKFAPARRDHWVRAWNADPEGARQLIASLAPGLIPTEALGYNDADDKDFDAEFGHLFPPNAKETSRG
ncbi:peptidoglycan-binding protein [Dactylosporangium sp. CA-052675]|uniref:peptidoglycan-binding protein n=1 Tax=Dactylosporangium sp. CA-052675 TaxID=3239927 RepID=UPI003D8A5DB9